MPITTNATCLNIVPTRISCIDLHGEGIIALFGALSTGETDGVTHSCVLLVDSWLKPFHEPHPYMLVRSILVWHQHHILMVATVFERCISFAKEWGVGGIVVVNLFAFRATSPDEMMTTEDPIGPLNDHTILKAARAAGMAICAWGNSGSHLGRSSSLKKILVDKGVELFCLGTNDSGEPKHPLYIKGGTKLKHY